MFLEPKSHVIYHLLIPWIGTGLLVANGNKWFRSRKLLTPAFHYGVLKSYIQVYNECAQTLIVSMLGCICVATCLLGLVLYQDIFKWADKRVVKVTNSWGQSIKL